MKKVDEFEKEERKLREKMEKAWHSLGYYGQRKTFVQWNQTTKKFRIRRWCTSNYISVDSEEACNVLEAHKVAQRKIQ